MKLRLGGIRRVVESLMVDDCTIYRDLHGTEDNEFDSDTGLYAPAESGGNPGLDDARPIYNGPCMFSVLNMPGVVTEGGIVVQEAVYQASILIASSPVLAEDVLTLNRIHDEGDQSLANKSFLIRGQLNSTYPASRRFYMVAYEPVPQ